MLMVGTPGAGKSMLAARLTTILPPLTTEEALETCMIHSVAGALKNGEISFDRPYRDPHHNASTPALIGGGRKGIPGEISLAHNGVLFLDELPEFNRATLEALRQPIETGSVTISRVNLQVDSIYNPLSRECLIDISLLKPKTFLKAYTVKKIKPLYDFFSDFSLSNLFR